MRKAVYTAIADDYEPLRDHPRVDDVDWVAYVTHPQKYEGSNWDVRPLFSYGETDPRRQAKWYKVQSLIEMAEYDRTLWIDGSVEIIHNVAVRSILDANDPIAVFKHDDRNCIYKEAGFSLGMRKYQYEPIRDQVQYYIDEYEHPQHWGLWFTTVILRNRCPEVERIERSWWNEIERWSYQDQLSFPVVLRNLGVKTAEFPTAGIDSFKFHQQPEAE